MSYSQHIHRLNNIKERNDRSLYRSILIIAINLTILSIIAIKFFPSSEFSWSRWLIVATWFLTLESVRSVLASIRHSSYAVDFEINRIYAFHRKKDDSILLEKNVENEKVRSHDSYSTLFILLAILSLTLFFSINYI